MKNFSRKPGPDYAASLTIAAPIETVYAALTTADGLRGWWTCRTDGSPEPGGEIRFEFTDYDIYKVMRVVASTRPTSVRWLCVDCKLTDWIGTTLDFELTASGPATTELSFTHKGLQPALECFESCEAGWDYYLRSLASYAETGTGQPYAD